MEGLRFIRGRPVLLGAIALDMFAVLFGECRRPAAGDRRGPPGRRQRRLRLVARRRPASVPCIVTAMPGDPPGRARHVGRTLLVAVAVFGVATIVLGITGHFAVAFVALLVLAGADAGRASSSGRRSMPLARARPACAAG